MALTPEEERELAELEALEAQERNQPIDTSVEPTNLEAFSAGVMDVGLKHVVAGYDTIKEAVTSEEPVDLESFVDRHQQNLEDINKTINMAEEASPIATGIGQAVTGAAIAGPFGPSLKAAIGTGAGISALQAEDLSPSELVTGGVSGAVGFGAGKTVGKIAKKPIEAAGKLISKKADEALAFLIGTDRSFGAPHILKRLQISGQSKEEFVDSVRKLDLVDFGDSADTILVKAQRVKKELGKEISQFYKQIDDEFKPEVDLNQVKNRIKDDVISDFFKSKDPETRKIGAELNKFVEKLGGKVINTKSTLKPTGTVNPDGSPIMFTEVVEEIVEDSTWSIPTLHSLKTDIQKRVSSIYSRNNLENTEAKVQQAKVASSIGNIIEDVVESLDTPENPVFSKLKDLNMKFGNASTIQEVMENKVAKAVDDPTSLVKELLTFRGTALMGTGFAIGGVPGAIGGFALNRIIRSPKTPTYLANGLPTLARHLTGDPTGKIATRLTAASVMTNQKFRKVLDASIAELNLKISPIPRDTQEALTKQEDIEKMLAYHLPSQLPVYKELVKKGDEEGQAAFLDSLSKDAENSDLFEEGIGFNNKVFAEEDKLILENQVKNTDMPAVERMKLLKALRKEGIIPDMSSVEPRQPKETEYRKSREPLY